MAETCGEVYDSSDEYSRDARIETYYQGWGAREMAERIVELEDELGADVDGICTGMHADVAEAQAEIDRLRTITTKDAEVIKALVCSVVQKGAYMRRYRLAWLSARRRAEVSRLAARAARRASRAWRARAGVRNRYRLAWLSARRRAADEANMGMEALELKAQEIRRLRADLLAAQRQTTDAPHLEHVGTDEDGDIWRLAQ